MPLSIYHLKIEKASINDLGDALELLKITALNLQTRGIEQWDYWLDPPVERLNWISEGFKNGEFTFLKKNEQLAAMYRLMTTDFKYWGHQDIPSYYLHSLVVHPDYKGLQIGNQILNAIKEKAVENDISLLRLDCDSSNQGLCNYYLNHGFKRVGQKQMPNSLNNLYELQLS